MKKLSVKFHCLEYDYVIWDIRNAQVPNSGEPCQPQLCNQRGELQYPQLKEYVPIGCLLGLDAYHIFVLYLFCTLQYKSYLIRVCHPLPIPIDTKDWVVGIVFYLGLKKSPLPDLYHMEHAISHMELVPMAYGILKFHVSLWLLAIQRARQEAQSIIFYLYLTNSLENGCCLF